MPRSLLNWSYKDVTGFLRDHGFEFMENRKGSHEAWINKENQAIVDINFHGSKEFPPRTLETMIRQSKLDKKEWRTWASK